MRTPFRARCLSGYIVIALASQACASSSTPALRDVRSQARQREPGTPVSTAELQQALERSTGTFLDQVAQAAEVFNDPTQAERQTIALRRVALYGSSALDIATGPLPEVNLLDMLVFLALSRSVLESYWVPQQLGPQAEGLVSAFAESEQQMWALSEQVLSGEQRVELRNLIAAWRERHREQVHVEWVRFQDFALRAGVVERAQADQAQGLLGSLKAMSQSTDRAVTLGARAMFLANRMPFLLRLQARLAVRESVDDTLGRLESRDVTGDLRPVLERAVELGNSSREAAHEMRLLYESLEPALAALQIVPREHPSDVQPTITYRQLEELMQTSNQLADRSLSLTRELRQLTGPESSARLGALEAGVNRLLQRVLVYLVVLGLAWALCFWGGYYVVKRAARKRGAREAS